MADTGTHPFFYLLVMFRISEHQSNTLVCLLTVLYTRKIGTIVTASGSPYYEESRNREKISFDQYGIAQDELYKFDQPTYQEFAGYSNRIMGDDVPPHMLLSALRDQLSKGQPTILGLAFSLCGSPAEKM